MYNALLFERQLECGFFCEHFMLFVKCDILAIVISIQMRVFAISTWARTQRGGVSVGSPCAQHKRVERDFVMRGGAEEVARKAKEDEGKAMEAAAVAQAIAERAEVGCH